MYLISALAKQVLLVVILYTDKKKSVVNSYAILQNPDFIKEYLENPSPEMEIKICTSFYEAKCTLEQLLSDDDKFVFQYSPLLPLDVDRWYERPQE